VTRNFETALVEFKKVLERYPASLKVADARLKLGYIYYELKRWKEAREMLETVVSRHAQSRAARLAQQRLERMKAEGR
jgi:TolA-binding protein